MINSLYDKFKDWSKKGSIYIISDTHFDDADCKLMNPNWITSEEHIKILNSHIMKTDTLICLGDVGNEEWFKKLKVGYKILITGNHDKGGSTYSSIFNEVYTGPLFIADRLLLSHEPIYGLENICINIHGHCHNGVYKYNNHINLASDVVNFQPFNLGKEIKNGLLKEVDNYHRKTIDCASEHSLHRR